MTVWEALDASRAIQGVARQIAAGETSHAWLLLGPTGSGKRATATAMAAALICPVTPGVGCSTCSTCRRVLRYRYPDVHHIVPEGPLIPVDLIREYVIPEASRSPFEAARKVFVIEEADRMNASAQNALLKTLEEPQPDTVFVLISDQEEEVLETIRSRCRIVRLEPVPERRTVELLRRDGATEQIALLAARVSDGDLGQARALAFDESARDRRSVWLSIPERLRSSVAALDAAAEVLDEVRAAVKDRGVEQKTEVAELAEAMGEGRGTATARNALAKRHKRELRRLEEDVLGEALQALGSFYRDSLAVRAGGAEAVANLDLIERVEVVASSDVSDAALVAAVERCVVARATLPLNANPLLQMEACLVELARLVPPPVPSPV